MGQLPDLFIKGPPHSLEGAFAQALRERHDEDVASWHQSWHQVGEALGLPFPRLPDRFPWERRR